MLIRTTLLSCSLIATLAAAPAHAQGPGAVWVEVSPGAPAGQEATLTVGPGSNGSLVELTLMVHGFWRESVVGGDGLTYDRLTFPGLDRLGIVGAPELPAIRPRCATSTTATQWKVAGPVASTHVFFSGYEVYPTPTDARDEAIDPTVNPGPGNPNGADEIFQKDPVIYGQSGLYPGTLSPSTSPIGLRMGSIPAGSIELTPASFDPSGGRLRVSRQIQVTYEATGGGATFFPGITVDRERRAAATFINWPFLGGAIFADTTQYLARYLIVTPQALVPTLEPFILHRKEFGYPVTLLTLESLPAVNCTEIQAGIDAWYSAGPNTADHFALLVGDESDLPTCLSPDGLPTDDPYGSVGADDLDEEVLVGRWSVDDAADLAARIDTLMAYELDQSPNNDYREVLGAAHIDGAPLVYEANLQAVVAGSYAVAVSFTTVLGSSGTTNSVLQTQINKSKGLVAYRGHGTANSWPGWNGTEDFHKNEVIGLDPDMTPVVWSVACNHNLLGRGDSLGETWLEEGHAVAHYGASDEGGRRKNDRLHLELFNGTFDRHLAPHGHALAWAEDQIQFAAGADTFENEWLYSLLGCPATRVRLNTADPQFQVIAPSVLEVGGTANGFTIQVLDLLGLPVEGAIVSVYKEAFDGSGDEILYAGVTNSGGTANIPMGPSSLGLLMTQTRDCDGNVAEGIEIAAKAGAFIDLGGGSTSIDHAPRMSSESTLEPNSQALFRLTDSRPSAPGVLFGSTVDPNLPLMEFDAVLHVSLAPAFKVYERLFIIEQTGEVDVIEPVVPDLSGSSGQMLYFQAVYLDEDAPGGWGTTNGLRAVIP